ncbi:hypothetical protein ACIBEK_25515 [Nocardia fusca]|jgi:hypothetical protein|uniref:hypothetical protein n=1 Tax=Nocardia fusca TaxID=941183 RepID=UPI0037A7E7EC
MSYSATKINPASEAFMRMETLFAGIGLSDTADRSDIRSDQVVYNPGRFDRAVAS